MIERAYERTDVEVIRCERRRQPSVNAAEIGRQRPVRRHAAERRLPRVHVRIDQARNDDATSRVELLSIRRLDFWSDGDDPVVLDEYIEAAVADGGIHRDDLSARNQYFHQLVSCCLKECLAADGKASCLCLGASLTFSTGFAAQQKTRMLSIGQ